MAIVLDSTATGTNFGTAVSVSLNNVAGTFLIAALSYSAGGGLSWSAVSYDSAAMTSQVSANNLGGAVGSQIFSLASPSTGTKTFAATLSGNAAWACALYSFTGVNNVDTTTSSTAGSGTGSISLSASVSANAWIIDCAGNNNTNTMTPGTGQTNRHGALTGFGNEMFCTTNGPLSAGTNGVSWTATSFSQPAYTAIAIDPTASAAAASKFGQSMIPSMRRML